MAIRIDPLVPNYFNPFILPPEAEIFVLSSQSVFQIPESNPDSELKYLYGGTAASVAILPQADSQPQLATSPDAPLSHPSAISNWSTALQTVLDRPPPTLPSQFIVGGIVFCAAFATWANVGQIDEVGRAQGRLVPEGEPYKVHPVVSGKVANVYVREGQSVRAGDLVAELDNEIALNRIEWLHQENASYQKELVQTEALIDKTQLEAQNQIAITHAEVQAQEATIAQVQAKIDSQNTAITQAEMREVTGQNLLKELQEDATAQQERMARLQYLVDEGALSKDQLFQAQRALNDRQLSITQQTGEIQQAATDSQRLQADLQQVIAEYQCLQAQLTQKYAEGQNAQLQAQQTIQQLLMQKTQLQAKIQQNEKQLQQAKTELGQLALRAPVSGVILSLNVPNKGEVVQPGQTIAEMASQNAPLVLEAALPTREAGFIKVGDSTQIKFDAYPYQDYGIVSGKVTAISPDVKLDEHLGAVYRVEISLDRNFVRTTSQTIAMKAGQTATAEIVTRRRHIVDILLDPIRKLETSSLSL